MSICHSGLNKKVVGQLICIDIGPNHPLIKLANALSWETIADIVLPDLKSTTSKKKWWVGRPLRLRIHLGIYILQQLFNKTDRQIEYDVKDNAAYQLFCGREIVKKWHAPDHTKIEEFRSRISPETQQRLANHVAVIATQLGFTNASEMDIDSTVQEANISYPSDTNLLAKLAAKAKKVRDYVVNYLGITKDQLPEIDFKKIKSQVRTYFFKKQNGIDEKRSLQRTLWKTVCSAVKPMLQFCEDLQEDVIAKIKPWNIRQAISQLKSTGKKYLIDVAYFLRKKEMKPGKLLAFHAQAVSCFNKNKLDRKLQFGRNFQLGRIGKNFLIVGKCETVRQEDKKSIQPMVNLHQQLFGEKTLDSAGADKGYYSKKNEKFLKNTGVNEIGLQKPARKNQPALEEPDLTMEKLINRRSGIEPLIGHAKHKGQLGQSRMKSDRTTESAGYAAILGFNGRQLIRNLTGVAALCR